ncbi:MAG: NAD(+) synthase [Bacillota bacterium]|nr:NAD(+) synthase [Bacillota bacterium]
MKNKVKEIVDWLKKYKETSGQKGFVLGLSGGVDSSVVAQLLMRACPNDCLGVIMPAGNKPQDKEDAIAAAEASGMPYIEVNLTQYRQGLFDDVLDALKGSNRQCPNETMVRGNIGARLRMTTLYAVGGSLSYLVVGTDNAAESYTGYFTKYGDGGVDILPISHLTKGEVFEMGRYLGVPEPILTKSPSAGFFHEQTDEEEMGVSYETIDAYLRGETVPEDKKSIIEHLHRISKHKRMMPPTLKS